MTSSPPRDALRLWLESQPRGDSDVDAASGPAPTAGAQPPHPLPASLPFQGYVIWFFLDDEYLGMQIDARDASLRVDEHANADDAFLFETAHMALVHLRQVERPALVLYAPGEGEPVTIAG